MTCPRAGCVEGCAAPLSENNYECIHLVYLPSSPEPYLREVRVLLPLALEVRVHPRVHLLLELFFENLVRRSPRLLVGVRQEVDGRHVTAGTKFT